MVRTVITGSGSYIPPFIQSNQDFAQHAFYDTDGSPLSEDPGQVVDKFKKLQA
jgi:3-oxoacyl-[acyl-carrier-protein] synthase-3